MAVIKHGAEICEPAHVHDPLVSLVLILISAVVGITYGIQLLMKKSRMANERSAISILKLKNTFTASLGQCFEVAKVD